LRRVALRLEFGGATQIEGEGVGGGEFEVGGEGFGEFEEVVQGLGFGVGVAWEDEKFRATGEGPGDGEAGLEPEGGGTAVEGEDRDAVVGFLGGGDATGKVALFRVVAEKRFEGERWEMEGEVQEISNVQFSNAKTEEAGDVGGEPQRREGAKFWMLLWLGMGRGLKLAVSWLLGFWHWEIENWKLPRSGSTRCGGGGGWFGFGG
jgi:hypothetical protein